MGMCASRRKESFAWEKNPKMFIHKMNALQQEINNIIKQREEDGEAYERELMLFAFKEAEWKKERKKLREEVKRLRRHVEQREERIRLMEVEVDQMIIGKVEQFEGKSSVGSSFATATGTSATTSMSLMDQMKEERARRDETVEKWKMLYLAIKNELDDLIHKTHQGTLYWRADDEDMAVGLLRELKAKDEMIEVLKAQVISMENEEYNRKREVDILRQSLKIASNNNKVGKPLKHAKNCSKPSIRLTKSFNKLTLVN